MGNDCYTFQFNIFRFKDDGSFDGDDNVGAAAAHQSKKSRLSNAERSAYFSRREYSVPFSKNLLVAEPSGDSGPSSLSFMAAPSRTGRPFSHFFSKRSSIFLLSRMEMEESGGIDLHNCI
ncbi:hypothetical protein SLEP1_g12840 [Rubroshorea leprosula]|uniref:Uncharacterized protein n=1 Tax=Rubroshorea leprosula TaxID=152421 RepID=A0AAV5IDU4_9ROSI|nr:hypothetical protein SLEP1_g12840 [Rubroshorea leprosula]